MRVKRSKVKRGFSRCDCCNKTNVPRFILIKFREKVLRLLCYLCYHLPKYYNKEVLEIQEVI